MPTLPAIPLVSRQEQADAATGRFERQPSAAFTRAVQAIQDLAAVEGWDMADRAIAEAVSMAYLCDYEDTYQVRQGRSGGGLARLAGTSLDVGLHFPGGDHGDLWVQDGKVARATQQPYGPLHDTQLREMLAFCKQHALTMMISPRSYHFAGRTLLINLAREDGAHMP